MGKYDMEFGRIKLADCISPDFNPRRISDYEFEQLKESIRAYGYSDPIIINKRNKHIVAGNQRHRALTELNRENHGKYTVIDVVFVDLPLCDEKAFNIGHNKIGGEFDPAKLQALLDELDEENYDLSLTGFLKEYERLDVDLDDLEGVDTTLGSQPEQYIITVKCVDVNQMNYLYDDLRAKGFNVKSSRF